MRGLYSTVLVGVIALLVGLMPGPGRAAEGFRLAAPQPLVDSGLLKHVLPRFSLKTSIRIELVGEDEAADVLFAIDADGPRVFTGPNATWRMQINTPSHEGAAKFAKWMTSSVGQRTVTSYAVDGTNPFALPEVEAVEIAPVSFDGDPVLGQQVSVSLCARCHAVNEETRMNALGSTPSFMVLRSMADWDYRFQAFYVLNPHPSFTQIKDLTDPFPIDRPSPIVPVEMTLDDLEAILAYVAVMEPADLGAPIQHQ